MITVRLKEVERDVDFRSREDTHFDHYIRKAKLKLRGEECMVLISKTQREIMFLFGDAGAGETATGIACRAIMSIRLRLQEGRAWHDYMLVHYAAEKGINIVNLPRLKQRLADEAEDKAAPAINVQAARYAEQNKRKAAA